MKLNEVIIPFGICNSIVGFLHDMLASLDNFVPVENFPTKTCLTTMDTPQTKTKNNI